MNDTPPRRSRRTPPKSGGPSLPFIPIFIGVIILGFVIGAGLSLAGKHVAQQTTVAVATSTPEPTLEPVTPAPTEVPTPEPTDRPATPEPAPSPRGSVTAPPPTRAPGTPQPTHAPLSVPVAAATAAPASPSFATAAPAATLASPPAAVASPAVAVTSAAPAASVATNRPAPKEIPVARTAAPAVAAASAAASSDETDSDFGKQAAGVVRTYIAAVAHGDIAGAYGALGQSAPANDANLPEIGLIDGTARIRHLETHGSQDAAAVDVDLQTSSGLYLAQYTVHRSPSGNAVIVAHTIIKP